MSSDLKAKYAELYEKVLTPTASLLESLLRSYSDGLPHIDRVAARAKRPESFLKKASKTEENGTVRYTEPLVQIQDLIGARVIVFYSSDIAAAIRRVTKYFQPIEQQDVVPDSEWTFGYFGRHFILKLPADAVPPEIPIGTAPTFFELQIKTLFQHAWSEAEHDLGYKAPEALTHDQLRYLAFTSAQAWGADDVFQRLARDLLPHDAHGG